jgi:uncharacterized membrane protein YhaH (DUF805 family)
MPSPWSISMRGRIGRLRFLVWGLPINFVALSFAYLLPIVMSHHGRDMRAIVSAIIPLSMALVASRFVNGRMEDSGLGRVPVFFPIAFSSGLFLAVLLAFGSRPAYGLMQSMGLFALGMALYGGRLVVLRLHDIGWSAWLGLVMLVPGANIVMWLLLQFWPGAAEGNPYGDAPQENTLGVYLGIALIPLLLFVRFKLLA